MTFDGPSYNEKIDKERIQKEIRMIIFLIFMSIGVYKAADNLTWHFEYTDHRDISVGLLRAGLESFSSFFYWPFRKEKGDFVEWRSNKESYLSLRWIDFTKYANWSHKGYVCAPDYSDCGMYEYK